MKKAILFILISLIMFTFIGIVSAQDFTAEDYYNQATDNFRVGKYKEMIELCKKAIEKDPKCLLAYFAMGRAYTILNKPQEAISAFNSGLKVNPNDGDSYIGLGAVYRLLGQYQKAIDVLNKALEVEPNNANNKSAYAALAGIYLDLKLYDECLLSLEKAKELSPGYGDIYVIYAEYYKKNSNIAKAKDNYMKAIEIYRKDGLEDLASNYEKRLNEIDSPIVRINLKSGCIIIGRVIEETEKYLKVKGSTYYPGPGDGFGITSSTETVCQKEAISKVEALNESEVFK